MPESTNPTSTTSTTETCDENYDALKLVRDGTHQGLRLIPALDPANMPIDDTSVAHRLMFAKSYAAYLKYYNTENVHDGNWQNFFSNDPAVLLANCVVQDVDYYKTVVQTSFAYLNDIVNATNATGVRENVSWLFAYVGTLAQQLDVILNGLPTDVVLRATLENIITTRLAQPFARLISYYKADLLTPASSRLILSTLPAADADHDIVILGATPVAFGTVYAAGLSGAWLTSASTSWTVYVSGIAEESEVFGDTSGSVFERANHMATHNLFTSVFDQFLMALARIVGEANAGLESIITSYPKHQPHYALFLAFLQLLENARSSLNTLTASHLDYYYRDILQLKERAVEPSGAHLILEPAKNVAQYEVAEGTRFRAKDAEGTEVFFAADRSLVVNQAVVASLKKLYRHDGELFVAPIANSDDGVTDVLKSDDKSWHPFFNVTTDGTGTTVDMVPASFGFAIASHYLLLAEGSRTITLTLNVSGYTGADDTDFAAGVQCSFSGEEGWFEGTVESFIATGTTLVLTVAITGDQPAIINVDTKTHVLSISPAAPMMKVILTHVEGQEYIYDALESVVVLSYDLFVEVDRVKNLVLSNDFGSIDPSKPFLPFGAQPEAGSAFIVGSQEMFGKHNLLSCNLHITWKNIPGLSTIAYKEVVQEPVVMEGPLDGGSLMRTMRSVDGGGFELNTADDSSVPKVNVQFLMQGAWGTAVPQTLFDGDAYVMLNIAPTSDGFNALDSVEFLFDTTFNARTKTGFVRLSLTEGMGHVAYREAYADYVLAVATGGSSGTKPAAPYTPEVEDVHASYSARQEIFFNTTDTTAYGLRQGRLFHMTDFGIAEQHEYLKSNITDKKVYLFPQTHESELYIGFTGLVPPASITVLFQTIEGTANPLALKPDPHLTWSYLQSNEWMPFASNDIEDGTSELLASGIVTLAMPREASTDNTLLPSGLHWVRVAVDEKSDAVCRLVLVAAQAVEVTLADAASATSVTTLPAGTITRLERPDSSIKKVTQPAETFGGKGVEESTDFYTRISERLRHKDRAITIWDFEHLVLEAFPSIHRVKCLNHTRYEPTDSSLGIYKELAPGHVTIITIPDTQGSDAATALKPYTSLGVLEEIEAFLLERTTCFATLHVRNPQFEEVRVSFKVRLHDGYDQTYYTILLSEVITQYLSPWAYSNSVHPSFGGKIYQSSIVHLVEQQPYVDYVTDFMMYLDVGGVLSTTSNQYVEGTRAVSILVSAPATSHSITVINSTDAEALQEQCECEE